MPTLDAAMEGQTFGTHLLLCGDSKAGKSRYVANAAKDGYTVLYIDSDNGGNTISRILSKDKEALRRVIYVQTTHPYLFFKMFTENQILRWNLTQDARFASASAKPDDDMLELIPSKIPAGVIVSFDSWTSIALDCMRYVANDKSLSIESMGGESQKVYGEAAIRLTSGLLVLQRVPFHTIVQAHGMYYERQEKPTGKQSGKQQDMIVKETIQIPFSCSKPHGHQMAKYFNEVGWMGISRTENFQLDFKQKYDRIGGGTPGDVGDPESAYRFSKIFGQPIEQYSESDRNEWYREMKAADFVPPSQPAAKPAADTTATGNSSASSIPPKGTLNVNSLLKKK